MFQRITTFLPQNNIKLENVGLFINYTLFSKKIPLASKNFQDIKLKVVLYSAKDSTIFKQLFQHDFKAKTTQNSLQHLLIKEAAYSHKYTKP